LEIKQKLERYKMREEELQSIIDQKIKQKISAIVEEAEKIEEN
jgi:hypothetical protein